MTTRALRKDLITELSGLVDDDFITVIVGALSTKKQRTTAPEGRSVHDVAAFATLLRVTLGADERLAELAGGPRLVHESVNDAFADLAILTQARRAVLDVEMLTSAAVAEALGQRGRNPREAASRLRQAGTLLGVPDTATRGYLYPAFQIDPVAQRVRPVVAEVNRTINAATDPWAAASWWVTPHGRLDEGQAPMDLIGGAAEHDLLVLAGAAAPSTASDARSEVLYDETAHGHPDRLEGSGPELRALHSHSADVRPVTDREPGTEVSLDADPTAVRPSDREITGSAVHLSGYEVTGEPLRGEITAERSGDEIVFADERSETTDVRVVGARQLHTDGDGDRVDDAAWDSRP